MKKSFKHLAIILFLCFALISQLFSKANYKILSQRYTKKVSLSAAPKTVLQAADEGIGGVLFMSVAQPTPEFERVIKQYPFSMKYIEKNEDGERLQITMGGKTINITDMYDWLLLPCSMYADSKYTAVVTLLNGKHNGPMDELEKDRQAFYNEKEKLYDEKEKLYDEKEKLYNEKIKKIREFNKENIEELEKEYKELEKEYKELKKEYKELKKEYKELKKSKIFWVAAHPALMDTLIVFNALLVDAMLIDDLNFDFRNIISEMSSLKEKNFKGYYDYELDPVIKKKAEIESTDCAQQIDRKLKEYSKKHSLYSYIYSERDEGINFYIENDQLLFDKTSHPIYHFLDKNDDSTPELAKDLTDAISTLELVRGLSPAIYKTAIKTAQYASFFRYIKKEFPEAWNEFMKPIKSKVKYNHNPKADRENAHLQYQYPDIKFPTPRAIDFLALDENKDMLVEFEDFRKKKEKERREAKAKKKTK